jgi:hypothetical protein
MGNGSLAWYPNTRPRFGSESYVGRLNADDSSRWPTTAPGGTSSSRVYRGGCFNFPAANARSADRDYFAPPVRGNILGLRPARTYGFGTDHHFATY